MQKSKSSIIILLSLVILFILSLLRFVDGFDSWIIDLFSNFPFQYALLAGILFLVCVWKKHVRLSLLALLIFAMNIFVIIDFGISAKAAEYDDAKFKVYSANIHLDNRDLLKLNNEIKELDPEIVLLLEVMPEHIDQIDTVIQTYSHGMKKMNIGLRGNGFVFLSKYPVLNYQVTRLSYHGNMIFEAMLEINHKQVMFYGIHAQRPGKYNFDERKSQFFELAGRIKEQNLPVIVAGDLNATPFSPVFKELIKVSGLNDSREGFGWQPSWPAWFPLLSLPIDHILVSPEVYVHERAVLSHIGSDHYPVIAELSINTK